MAITRVADGTTQQAAAGVSMTPGLPAGLAQDDIMVFGATTIDNIGITSAPGGWSQASFRNNGSSHRHEIWLKRATSSESTPTFVRSGGGTGISRIAAYRGISSTDALADLFESIVGSDSGGASTTTATHPAIDPLATYVFILAFTSYGINASNAGVFAGSNPTYTNRWVNQGTTAVAGQCMEDGENDGANIAQRTKTVTSAPIIVQVLALREAALPPSVQQLRPDADVDAASWGTTPLWSKVNDESDATVISDTLV